jgi:biopolymer transport protein ExbD
MAMSAPKSGGDDQPMGEMNTTPLIDVMLVLLIMFIITLPKPTDSVPIDLPADCKATNTCPPTPPVEPERNVLYVSPYNQVLWNGTEISFDGLLSNLKQTTDETIYTKERNPNGLPELVFDPDPQAKFDTVNRVIKLIKIAKVNKMGFARNGSFAGEVR